MKDHYDDNFYSRQIGGSIESSQVVIPILTSLFHPQSVVDVGCGLGGWLRTCIENRITDVQGIEGAWVAGRDLLIDKNLISIMDLNQPRPLPRLFDLAMSLEVAEHLSPELSDAFVGYMCSLSDLIMFSAAIPGQGGDNHINENWQSAWAQRFAAKGFSAFDIIRPRIWRLNVEPWYAQNIIIYGNGRAVQKYREVLAPVSGQILDIVHPLLFQHQKYTITPSDIPFLLRYKAGHFLRRKGWRK